MKQRNFVFGLGYPPHDVSLCICKYSKIWKSPDLKHFWSPAFWIRDTKHETSRGLAFIFGDKEKNPNYLKLPSTYYEDTHRAMPQVPTNEIGTLIQTVKGKQEERNKLKLGSFSILKMRFSWHQKITYHQSLTQTCIHLCFNQTIGYT